MGGYLGQGVGPILTPDKFQESGITVSGDTVISPKLTAPVVYVDFNGVSKTIVITLPKISNSLFFRTIVFEVLNAPTSKVCKLTINIDSSDNFDGSTSVMTDKVVNSKARIALTHNSASKWTRNALSETDPLGISRRIVDVPDGVVLSDFFLKSNTGFYRLNDASLYTSYTNDMGFDPATWYDVILMNHEIDGYRTVIAISSYGDMLSGTFANKVWTGFKGTTIPAGVPIPYPGANPPAGYLLVNGGTFDTAKYPMLGKLYPSGVLPDLRGEFIRGWDNGRGVDSGRSLLSTQSDAIRNITGTVYGRQSGTSMKVFSNGSGAFSAIKFNPPSDDTSTAVISSAVGSTSLTDRWSGLNFDASLSVPVAADNRPRNTAYNYIVRAQ